MALQQTECEIGGQRYQLTALPSEKGRKTMMRLFKIVGPSVAALFRGRGQTNAEEASTIAGDAIANAIQELAERMGEDDLEYLFQTFLRQTEVWGEGGGWVPMEKAGTYAAFSCDYGSMLAWLLKHIDWNFSSFLVALKSTVPRS